MRLRARQRGLITKAEALLTALKGERLIVGKGVGKGRDRATVTGSGLRVRLGLIASLVETKQLIQVEKGHWTTVYQLPGQI